MTFECNPSLRRPHFVVELQFPLKICFDARGVLHINALLAIRVRHHHVVEFGPSFFVHLRQSWVHRKDRFGGEIRHSFRLVLFLILGVVPLTSLILLRSLCLGLYVALTFFLVHEVERLDWLWSAAEIDDFLHTWRAPGHRQVLFLRLSGID